MYVYESTIFATEYPKYMINGNYHILPRPYSHCKPGNVGYNILNSNWFSELLSDIELAVLIWLQYYCKDSEMKKMYCQTSIYPKKIFPIVVDLANLFLHK